MTALCWASGMLSASGIVFVDRDFDGPNPTGASWESPFPLLEQAIHAAAEMGGDEIWVKAGVYHPGGFGRNTTFELQPNIALFGGFKGNESERSQRNATRYRTILSGDIGRTGSPADNCFHVVTGASDCRIDGFIITRGYANAAAENRFGGGLMLPAGTSNAVIANCAFEKNYAESGGAVHAVNATLSITNCTFFSNSAQTGGAIALFSSSSMQILNSTFSSNFSSEDGGAVFLSPGIDTRIKDSSFVYNSTYGRGGALLIEAGGTKNMQTAVSGCTFHENSATESGGALFFQGTFNPNVTNCVFERNASDNGAGAWANAQGVMAISAGNTFILNLGIEGLENLGNDDTSITAATPQALASAAKNINRDLLKSLKEEETPEPVPLRQLGEASVYDASDTLRSLNSFLQPGKHTVFILADLTDPEFINSYQTLEKAALLIPTEAVHFFYIYRYLLHPENNAFVQPFNLKERKRHTELAEKYLFTKIPWLYDAMDNQAAKALAPQARHSVFVYDESGLEKYATSFTQLADFQDRLIEFTGNTNASASTAELPQPTLKALEPLNTSLVQRPSINPKTDHFKPVQVTPLSPDNPHYVKARVEADKDLLETGSGRLYLGFHIDPLYPTAWNNLGEPMRYIIKTPAGVVAPSINSAPKITGHTSDTEPREFLLETRKLDLTKPFALKVTYSVYSETAKRNLDIEQRYFIKLEEDLFGGRVIGRQRITQPKPAINHAANRAGSAAFGSMRSRYDLDRDGKLSENEVIGGLRTNFSKIDTNQDGFIDEEEYVIYRAMQ